MMRATPTICATAAPRSAERSRDGSPAAPWIQWLVRMLQAIESRHQLARMDDRMLADIGLSRADALQEAGRAPWDLDPPRRRR